ncbi:hypothetical protein EI94DRAFT_1697817 [Lactarius quietus]|nr:hypothetical protein EI94DRAFT_1697817 [Lactarius quietus]
MPTPTTNQTGEKKATSSAQSRTMQLPSAPTSVAREPNKAKQPGKYAEARKYLNVNQILPKGAPCTPRAVANTLITFVGTYKIPDNISKALVHISEVAQQVDHEVDSQCQQCVNAQTIPDLLKELEGNFSKVLEQKLSVLEEKIVAPPRPNEHLKSATKEIGQAAQSIKAVASKMAKLTQADPRVLRDLDRKARQILVDTKDEKLINSSLAAIKEKISKLRRGGFTVLFKEKEVMEWMQDVGVECKFILAIAEDATLVKRTFPILVPHIPLTFDPSETGHLREVEECNELPEGSIIRARWIKPAYRRTRSRERLTPSLL